MTRNRLRLTCGDDCWLARPQLKVLHETKSVTARKIEVHPYEKLYLVLESPKAFRLKPLMFLRRQLFELPFVQNLRQAVPLR